MNKTLTITTALGPDWYIVANCISFMMGRPFTWHIGSPDWIPYAKLI